MTPHTLDIGRALAETSQRFYTRGWVLGTSGNFSVVVSRQPFRLAITASGRDKRTLRATDIVIVDADGRLAPQNEGESEGAAAQQLAGDGDGGRVASAPRRREAETESRPSAETLLHVIIASRRNAGAILHTHSVWSTILSQAHAAAGGLPIEDYEMLKGLQGVTTHEHREWIPIVDNDQDIPRLARVVDGILTRHPDAHALLLRRHGLYTWGDTLADAERHVEILEFLFEAIGRSSRDIDRPAVATRAAGEQ